MLKLPKYLIGVGDRLGHQGKTQLSSVITAHTRGLDIAIVCNLSHRAHSLIVTRPADVERETDAAVQALGWQGSYFVDRCLELCAGVRVQGVKMRLSRPGLSIHAAAWTGSACVLHQ